ncbi:MAG TPA: hypothetical protein VHF26_08080, partial [Trebonia sp.]|nr:hypothetical protein [Trebonia sp.]
VVGAAAAVAAVLAGCSSAPAPAPTPAAQAQAQRSIVLPAAKQLYSQLYRGRVGWTALILGSYQECGAHDPLAADPGGSKLQYTAQQRVSPFSAAVSSAAFSQQVVKAVNAYGWRLRSITGPSGQASYYAGARGGFDLWLAESNGDPGGGPVADIYVSGAKCFDAGSSAHGLLAQGSVDNVPEPRPAETPVPAHT